MSGGVQYPIRENSVTADVIFCYRGLPDLLNIVQSVGAGQIRSGVQSTSSTDFSLPRLHTQFGERAISHAGPSAWHPLSDRDVFILYVFLEHAARFHSIVFNSDKVMPD